jgi:predicted RNA-binding protein with PIN domain
MLVIIDGHNLLWAIRNVEADSAPLLQSGQASSPQEDSSITDSAMCRILDVYFGITGDRAEIIFDGIGPPNKAEFETIKNIEVTFSGRRADCDTVIEDKILASTAPKLLTIVSSDRRLRDAASARKAAAVKSEDFWDEVKKRLSRRKTSKEPPGKRSGLTESETELWLKTFGLDK